MSASAPGPTEDGRIEVVGTWRGGRTGTYREHKDFGGRAWGTEGEQSIGAFDGYAPMLVEVMRFFQTGIVPVPPEETIELFAFMEAADESRRRGGQPVSIDEMRRRAGDVPRPQARAIEVRKIWDAAPHSAFTDLARSGGQWLCVFREGAGHVSPDGAVRVLISAEGTTWTAAARLTMPGVDLRDPKLCVTPTGKWMLTAAAAYPESSPIRHQTYAWFSADGSAWNDPVPIGEPNVWLWRVTWHRNTAYGVGYSTTQDQFTRLYQSPDGRQFDVLVPRLFDAGYANEASLGFEAGDAMLCLLRRDGAHGTSQVGWARPPYTDWTWRDLETQIGGPHWLRIEDLPWLAAVRRYEPHARTALAWIDPELGRLSECLALPSGGDTSYAGLVWHERQLWVSYYSSHEGKSAIYLARVVFE